MKKIFALMSAAVLALGFTACSSDAEDIVNPSKKLQLNITVADFNGDNTTRAVKQSWVSGDRINLWYEGSTQKIPDLVIKYDGTKWEEDETVTVSGNEPSTSGGKIFFVYEGGNDLSKYSDLAGTYYSGIMNLLYGDNYWRPTSYTYVDNVLSFSLTDWLPVTEFQVVITGIDNPAQYQLKCTNLMRVTAFGGAGGITKSNNSYDSYVRSGIANEDGVAFYFGNAQDNSSSATYTFTLKNTSTNEEKVYSVSGKAHADYTFTAIKIAASSFE